MITHNHKYFGIVGWYGACAVIMAYLLINFCNVPVRSHLYLWLNLSGIVSVMIDGLYHKAYESVSVNVILGVITILSILKFLY